MPLHTNAQSVPTIDLSIVDSVFKPIQLGINEIKIRGEVAPSDSDLVQKMFRVLSDDLEFHLMIDTVMVNPFILKLYEVGEPDMMIWKQSGAHHVLTVTVEFSSDKIRMDYSLYNMGLQRESASDSYRMDRRYWRTLTHTISNRTVEHITEFPGIYNTRLVFVTAQTGNKEIYISDYDGANVQAVTKNGSINISPVWDSKNEAILYTSYKNGKPDLWQVNLKNSEHEVVASYPGINSAPAVSPNNREMLLTLSKDGNAEIYLTDRKGKIKRRMTNSYAIETSPAFSPSGREFAYTSDRTGGPQIYMMDTEGLNDRRITFIGKQNESPAISPQGDKIAYVTRSERGSFDICVADIDGSDFRIITDTGFNENPRWAPDGLHIIYSTQWNDRRAIFISDFMGYQRRLISNQPGCSNPDWSEFDD